METNEAIRTLLLMEELKAQEELMQFVDEYAEAREYADEIEAQAHWDELIPAW